MNQSIEIYTDGSYAEREKRGGWGAVICFPEGNRIELIGYEFGENDNNTMEVLAAVKALEFLSNYDTLKVLISDSTLLVNGFNRNMYEWKEKEWTNSTGNPVPCIPYWNSLLKLAEESAITAIFIKSHTGSTYCTRADTLSKIGSGVKKQ